VSDINVDDFCKDTARALTILYATFPRPQTLFVEDLAGPDRVDEFGVHSNRHLACFGTLLWLAQEGCLRYADTIRQEAVDQAVLSGRCFVLLSTPVASAPLPPAAADLPESVRLEQQTHVSQLRRALEERSSSQLRQVVLALLSELTSR
jgi:hypothetical protein